MTDIDKAIVIIGLLVLIAAVVLIACTRDKPDDSRDYMAEIIVALAKGDTKKAQKLNVLRDAKIDRIGMYEKIDVNDLYLLAKVVQAEGDELTDEQQREVASAIVSRTQSSEFPDTIADCIYQLGEYYTGAAFQNLLPSERALANALYVLEGKR